MLLFISMRLDMFLKTSRLARSRSEANRLCSEGRVSVDGLVAKASRNVSPGELIEISTGDESRSFEIVRIPQRKQVTKDEARELVKPQRDEGQLSPS